MRNIFIKSSFIANKNDKVLISKTKCSFITTKAKNKAAVHKKSWETVLGPTVQGSNYVAPTSYIRPILFKLFV